MFYSREQIHSDRSLVHLHEYCAKHDPTYLGVEVVGNGKASTVWAPRVSAVVAPVVTAPAVTLPKAVALQEDQLADDHDLSNLGWHELRRLARELGTVAKGMREDIERGIIEHRKGLAR